VSEEVNKSEIQRKLEGLQDQVLSQNEEINQLSQALNETLIKNGELSELTTKQLAEINQNQSALSRLRIEITQKNKRNGADKPKLRRTKISRDRNQSEAGSNRTYNNKKPSAKRNEH